jgi:hypothetical protein
MSVKKVHLGHTTAPVLMGFLQVCFTDVDECESVNDGCQHSCVNEVASYSSACDQGFILADGGHMCLGKMSQEQALLEDA